MAAGAAAMASSVYGTPSLRSACMRWATFWPVRSACCSHG
ncbi:Uncharacterised protein [Bordetella pertussis]|nr:Uncharacterised protein [Bordetella pertussis]